MNTESTSYTLHLEHAALSQNCCITKKKLNEQNNSPRSILKLLYFLLWALY